MFIKMVNFNSIGKSNEKQKSEKNYYSKNPNVSKIQINNLLMLNNQQKMAFAGKSPKKLAGFMFSIAQFFHGKLKNLNKNEIVENMTKIITLKMNLTPKDQPLIFAMPSFPFKSPSRAKTLSDYADRTEEESLHFLKFLMKQAEKHFKGDLKLKIFSDGLFFGPIKGVPNNTIINYSNDIKSIIGKDNHQIQMITLDELYPLDYAQKAKSIIEINSDPIEKIKQHVRDGGIITNSFNGIHRFYAEEIKGQKPGLSRSQCEKEGKNRAYQVIRGAQAVNNWISEIEPTGIRLSVHPQPLISEKIGIPLTSRAQNITPWHCSALEHADSTGEPIVYFIKAEEARSQGIEVVNKNGKPYCFLSQKGKNVVIKPYYTSHNPPGL